MSTYGEHSWGSAWRWSDRHKQGWRKPTGFHPTAALAYSTRSCRGSCWLVNCYTANMLCFFTLGPPHPPKYKVSGRMGRLTLAEIFLANFFFSRLEPKDLALPLIPPTPVPHKCGTVFQGKLHFPMVVSGGFTVKKIGGLVVECPP